MTQVWPDFGDAPVPTLLSMICNPEAVVMGFPAVWADAIRGTAIGVATAATTVANAVRMIVRREDRISVHLVRETDVSSPEQPNSIAIFRQPAMFQPVLFQPVLPPSRSMAKSRSNGEVFPAIRSPI